MANVIENVKRNVDNLSHKGDYHEGKLTRALENQTAKIPSMTFLDLAVGSMILSAGLAVFKKENAPLANFVGLWAPTFLLLGIYNKLVKIEGNDRYSRTDSSQAA